MPQWIDLALLPSEDTLSSAIKDLDATERELIKGELFALLGIERESFDQSILRILIERSRALALPGSLWSRRLDASSNVSDASRGHLTALGLNATASRLQAMQHLYAEFTDDRDQRISVTKAALEKCGFRCEHCGLAFCNQDLAHKGILSPHGNRPRIKRDPFKLHWSQDDRRRPTIDHDWPVSTFGSNHDSNLKVLCHGCNEGKANYLALEHVPVWAGMHWRSQLVQRQVSLPLFYAQIRRAPSCSLTGAKVDTKELTVSLRDPQGPAILDNLMTIVSED